jgi:hypothetical protein
VSILAGLLLYHISFRPTIIKNARRLDRYGLEERLITMVDLEGDDSCIALKQREDAMAALERLDKKRVKIKIPAMIIALSVSLVLVFTGMTVVEVLSEAGILPSGAEVWCMVFPAEPLKEIRITYLAETGGYLIGEEEQYVTEGSYSKRILAVADEGFMFYAWSDGETDPSRNDKAGDRDVSLTAVFLKIEEADDRTSDEDLPENVPTDEGYGPSVSAPGGAGGMYQEINQIIDNKTYYRDEATWEEYYKRVIELLENGGQIPEELLAIVEAYFDIIK